MNEITRVLFAVENSQGYSADQITESMTLGDLLGAIEAAVGTYGEDALVVTRDEVSRYGASFGAISISADTFRPVDAEDE